MQDTVSASADGDLPHCSNSYRKNGSNARTVDPGEYEPQIVELPSPTKSVEEESDAGEAEESAAGKVSSIGSELSQEERNALWIEKLNHMREKYLASMTEEERVALFKRLEV